ncbi:MAG TPA: 2-oxoglutarate dehydrogenase E1 component, partial [Bacteroidetes bacterium]|nr:2-oxoglutarate dehydrogenase E1 component [Bacteroidota bacterium]
TCKMAMAFRQKFNRDVFIDLLCYRRHGHNEGDEPRFTQPVLYKTIAKHPNPLKIYAEQLQLQGALGSDFVKQMAKKFKQELQGMLNEVKKNPKAVQYSFGQSVWKDLRLDNDKDWLQSPETGVAETTLRELSAKMLDLPKDKAFLDKAIKIFQNREQMVVEDRLDWSMGELLAYATLLTEGHAVRMTGQDVERGTFAHRHAVLKIDQTEEEYVPLNHLTDGQSKARFSNSLLSEYAVLGFEYGYSWSAPYSLTIWEAQFGDFVNGAQIMLDQYISSAGQKWRRLSGLVMLLPHGFEGQGPEHSSARIERFLELSSSNNWQVVNPTTPAQMFHLLRRQIHRSIRVPLIVITPKNLLRLPAATSKISELAQGRFLEVIDDPQIKKANSVKRVVLCSGKLYYELLEKQEGRQDIAVVRLEQIYPVPAQQLAALKKRYAKAEWYWVQEEPENMGPWPFILRKLRNFDFTLVSRRESSSPATGFKKQHVEEQRRILETSFAKPINSK